MCVCVRVCVCVCARARVSEDIVVVWVKQIEPKQRHARVLVRLFRGPACWVRLWELSDGVFISHSAPSSVSLLSYLGQMHEEFSLKMSRL